MSPEGGSAVIRVARSLINSHYINGACGATPGNADGVPFRPGSVGLIADPARLDPTMNATAGKNLAVLAAESNVKSYCVCAGNYHTYPAAPGGREPVPTDPELAKYLASLKGTPSTSWSPTPSGHTPRRAYGPGPLGGDLGGKLVWGQSCKGIRHFDCVGFIAYCYWKATGYAFQLDISAWRGTATGATVYLLADSKPAKLLDGDILIKQDHHIAFVDASGEIFEAQDTDLGVQSTPGFNLLTPGTWTHLVRMPAAAIKPALEWPLGWWKVWDGNTWYYFFGADGTVKSSKTTPVNTRMPPAKAHNVGRYTYTPPRHLVIEWNKVAGAPMSCRETFNNAEKDCAQMNATSNLYSPLVAKRME